MKDRKHDGKHSGFTLAELLVVMAIIGIAFALILPAFTGIGGQSRLEGGADAVYGAVQLARRHAVSAKQPTYLLIQDEVSTEDKELAYRSFAVFTINTHTDRFPVPQEAGEFLTEWETLPQGIVFDPEASVTETENNIFMVSQNWNGAFNRNRQLRVGDTTYIALGFRPSGVHGTINDNDIFLCEGFYRNGAFTRTASSGRRIYINALGETYISDIRYTESGAAEELTR